MYNSFSILKVNGLTHVHMLTIESRCEKVINSFPYKYCEILSCYVCFNELW